MNLHFEGKPARYRHINAAEAAILALFSPKSIKITGINAADLPNGAEVAIIAVSGLGTDDTEVYIGQGTISGGSVTAALTDLDHNPYTGNGSFAFEIYKHTDAEPPYVVYAYTNGKTMTQLGITIDSGTGAIAFDTTDEFIAAFNKLPTIALTSATTTIPFSKFAKGGVGF